jgi:tetratricopeptide (TPR) repeat protein
MDMSPAIEFGKGEAHPMEDALLTAALLGAGLPEKAQRYLNLAAASYQNAEVAETHLLKARQEAPDHAAVLIGLYRFYFYKNRLEETLEIAQQCIRKAARDLGFRDDWRLVSAHDAQFGDFGAMLPRFFLFSLKGYAYLNMRLGEMDEARAAVWKLLELDPTDKIGARVLQGVLDRMGQDDDD